MIHTKRTVTVGKQESIIDAPIILYRGDREVEVEFTLVGNKYTFSSGGNVIESANATHGQLVLNTPSGENMFSEVTECDNGKVVFVITKEMIDELIEVGFYSFQIRLYDSEELVSRVTIPPVQQGFDIRNPIAAEDETNVVDQALVDYSRIYKDQLDEEVPTFDWNGDYNKTEWEHHDLISANKLNKIEDALYTVNQGLSEDVNEFIQKADKMEKEFQNKVDELKAEDKELGDEIDEVNRTITNRIDKLEVDVNVGDVAWKNETTEYINKGFDGVDSTISKIVNNSNLMILYPFFAGNNAPVETNFYISNDGYTLKRINNKPVLSVRDASIIYKNGYWLIAGTGYNPHDFSIYKSADLVSWTHHKISVGLYKNGNNKIWAPEWFEDDNGDIYVLISHKVGESIDIYENTIPDFRPYITKCLDIDNLIFENAKPLNLPQANRIDPCVIKKDGVYNMYIKDENDKYIEHWRSSNLDYWEYVTDIKELGQNVEGPTIININGAFYLYADMFNDDMGMIYYITSTDLITWSERKMLKTGMERVRHGSPLIVNHEKAQLDLCKFIISNIAYEKPLLRSKGYNLTYLADDEGYIDDLEIIDGCVYSVSGDSQVIIRSAKNTHNAQCFYLLIASNRTASITISDINGIIGVPNGYTYSAGMGDGDTLIRFIYNTSSGVFKPTTASINNTITKKANIMTTCKTSMILSTSTIDKLEIIDGCVYKVSGGNDVIINGVTGDVYDGAHFYVILNSGSKGSITINSGTNITVPGGTFSITVDEGRNDTLFEFIKVPSSTFRLKN